MNKPCSTDQCAWFASPLGMLRIRHDGAAISALDYSGGRQIADWQTTAALPAAWQHALSDYFNGELTALLALPVRLTQGTTFQQHVWLALRQIPAGQTYTYKQLAQAIGRPKAVRAVGQALSKNPISIILPCHRVILQSGELGGYAGNSDLGHMRKQFLLWHECGFGATRTSSRPPYERTIPHHLQQALS